MNELQDLTSCSSLNEIQKYKHKKCRSHRDLQTGIKNIIKRILNQGENQAPIRKFITFHINCRTRFQHRTNEFENASIRFKFIKVSLYEEDLKMLELK